MTDTPESPLPQLPFVTVSVLSTGYIQTQTNLKDRSLILGLLETAKFQIMLQPTDPPIVQPVNGAGALRKFLRR